MLDYTQFYINGEWVDPSSPNTFDVINPANEDVCAHIALGNEDDVNKAVAAAKTGKRSAPSETTASASSPATTTESSASSNGWTPTPKAPASA